MSRRSESGQALVLAIGGAFVLIAAALALVAIAGAVTGKGRAQRAADLVAISAVRSMRDDLPRLLSPPLMADGRPNPRHPHSTEAGPGIHPRHVRDVDDCYDLVVVGAGASGLAAAK